MSEDCYGDFIAKSNNNHVISWYMNKQHVLVFGVMIFLVLMVPLVINDAQAFNKHGPSPIPGNLIPFPAKTHYKHDSTIPPVMPPAKK